jgi:hypothetical protein
MLQLATLSEKCPSRVVSINAIKSFKDWNTFSGMSGVKGFIILGMEDLKHQLHQDIQQALDSDDQLKARVLALEMHELSQAIVMEMCSWMDAIFQELVPPQKPQRKRHGKWLGPASRWCLKQSAFVGYRQQMLQWT